MKKYVYVFVLLFGSLSYSANVQEPEGSVPRALRNLGNTCYMNAVLQALYSVQPLTEFALSDLGQSYYEPGSVAAGYVKFINTISNEYEAFEKNMDERREGVGHLLDTLKQIQVSLLEQIPDEPADKSKKSKKSKKVKKTEPTEVEQNLNRLEILIYELEMYLYDLPSKSEVCIPVFNLFEQEDFNTQQDASDFLEKLLNHLALEDVGCRYRHLDNVIKDNFEFSVNSAIVPEITGEQIIREEPSLGIQLNVMDHENREMFNNLKDCLNNYFAKEDMKDDGQYNYEGMLVDATKKLSLNSIPQYMVIQLKRFAAEIDPEYRGVKLSHGVSFPYDDLDLSDYYSDDLKAAGFENNSEYELMAIVHHRGNDPRSGHYTAHVKHDEKWYYCNDKYIAEEDQAYVKSIADAGLYLEDSDFTPYILFYKKKDKDPINQLLNLETTLNFLGLDFSAEK